MVEQMREKADYLCRRPSLSISSAISPSARMMPTEKKKIRATQGKKRGGFN